MHFVTDFSKVQDGYIKLQLESGVDKRANESLRPGHAAGVVLPSTSTSYKLAKKEMGVYIRINIVYISTGR